METSLDSILDLIKNSYSIDEEKISPIKKLLKKQFYFKAKDMKFLTYEKWLNYSLPDNLYFLITEKLNEIKSGKNIFISEKKNFENLEISNENNFIINNMKPINQLIKTIKTLENLFPNKNEINRNLIEIDNEIISKSENENLNKNRENVFNLLESVFTNIICHPTEEKYRKINIEKLLKKINYKNVEKFLYALKFKKTNDVNFIKFGKESVLLNEPVNCIHNFKNNNYEHFGLVKNEEEKNEANENKNEANENKNDANENKNDEK